jgi:hypothetical protein
MSAGGYHGLAISSIHDCPLAVKKVPVNYAMRFKTFQLVSKAPLIIATMTSKFMVNAAFEARLLLRPSHQPTALFGTVNKLGCPIPDRPTLPPILSSRSYSDSTSTPTLRLPKSFGSTEGSQSSGPEEKNWFTPKIKKTLIGLGGGLLTAGVLCAGYVFMSLEIG